MGVFDKIMNILYEEVPESAGTPAPANAPGGVQRPSQMLRARQGDPVAGTSAPSASGSSASLAGQPPGHPAPGTTPGPVRAASPAANETVYREFCDSLARAIEGANLPGFDFFEFHQLYNRFRSAGKSDDEALATALTSAETMRVSRNVLIANYKHYEKILGQQKGLFEKELQAFYNENIKGAAEKQSQIDRDVAAREEQIAKLRQEIEALKQRKEAMGVNAEKAVQQTEEVQLAFGRAFEEVSRELRALAEKIQSNG